jgi:hypothetical protein
MKKLLSLPVAIILISIAILQSGCLDQTSDQYPDVTAKEYTINGAVMFKMTDINGTRLTNWTFGEATLTAIVGGNTALATTKMDADGTFQLILPATIPGTYFNSLSAIATQQGGTIKATPDAVRLFGSTQFKVDYTDNGKAKAMYVSLASHNADLTVNRSYFFNFYDLDGAFIGKGTSGNDFNWTFTKGWGLVESYITNAATTTFNSKSITTAPGSAVWSN